MPLTDFQASLAKLLSNNRSPDSYLAGGAALHIKPNSKRYSNALDYFHDSEERVASAFSEDKELLIKSNYEVHILLQQPGFIRALVSLAESSTKVEWAHDSSWRFLPTVFSEEAGYSLNEIDLGINKLLALVGRDEPRDYLDIHIVISTVLPLGALCWAATGKDPGFTPSMLIEMLRRRGKYRMDDMNRLDLVGPVDLVELKKVWIKAVDEADEFMRTRPPDEIGCLYYSEDRNTFIQPKETDKVKTHFGKPEGVLPILKG